ncbi:hypothetical protein F5884DRAFT_744764 [Xylogone sp. PMI_703]|nr:hypothetical protein F5884DRAFT_744764 [Xylogone sp. PMI_703]
MLSNILLSSAAFIALALATPIHHSNPAAKTVVQLPAGSWLESLAVRSNGNILSTSLFGSTASLYTVVQPAFHAKNSAEVLTIVPGVQSLLGITEVPNYNGKETFFMVGGNFTSLSPLATIAGSFKGFKVTFSSHGKVHVEKVSNLTPDAAFANGVTAIPGSPGSVLVTDSLLATVGRLELSTGHYDSKAFVFPEMAAPEGSPLPVGVSAVRVRGSYLYFGNAARASIYRVKIDSKGYLSKGARPELVANISSVAPGLDDFVFDAEGNIVLATNSPENAVVHVDVSTGKSKLLIGGPTDPTVPSSTAVGFGRDLLDTHTIYVSTGRNLTDPSSGAKIVAVDTRLLK